MCAARCCWLSRDQTACLAFHSSNSARACHCSGFGKATQCKLMPQLALDICISCSIAVKWTDCFPCFEQLTDAGTCHCSCFGIQGKLMPQVELDFCTSCGIPVKRTDCVPCFQQLMLIPDLDGIHQYRLCSVVADVFQCVSDSRFAHSFHCRYCWTDWLPRN